MASLINQVVGVGASPRRSIHKTIDISCALDGGRSPCALSSLQSFTQCKVVFWGICSSSEHGPAVCLRKCISGNQKERSAQEVSRSGSCVATQFSPSARSTKDQHKWKILSMARDDLPAKKQGKEKEIEEYSPEVEELDELLSYLDLELESSTDSETNKHYEIMFLIHEHRVEEKEAILKKVQDFIKESKGIVYRLNDWGMRNLAYKIKKTSRANYILMNIEIDAQAINDLNTLFEKDERVIRHMVMSQKTAITADYPPPEEYRPSKETEQEEEDEDDDEFDDDGEDDEQEAEAELSLQRQ